MTCDLSIIIPTYCRGADLQETLKCINSQDFKNFEVIIVDASPNDIQLSQETIYSYGFEIIYVRHGIAGNVSKQRNIGLNLARGETILFLDDDVEFSKDLFNQYVRIFLDPSVMAVSGLVETKRYRKSSKPIPHSGLKIGEVGYTNHQCCDYRVSTNVICTANFAFRRSVFNTLGGFDELLFGSLDDVDFGFKLISNNIEIIHFPEVGVFHHQSEMSGARSNKLPDWWGLYNQIYFQLKHRRSYFFYTMAFTIFQISRPSRAWLNPRSLVRRLELLFIAYRIARKAIKKSI